MDRLVVTRTVDSDGKLHLDLPLGAAEAGKEVQVTVETIATKKPMTQQEWQASVLATAGSISDPSFERPPQGEFTEPQG